MIQEFKGFVAKGNVVMLAVGFIMVWPFRESSTHSSRM
jgi:large-conductance mechanosensitive channel